MNGSDMMLSESFMLFLLLNESRIMLIVQEILGYIFLGFIGIAGLAVFYLPVYFKLKNKVPLSRQITYFLFVACVLVILVVTILDSLVVNIMDGRGMIAAERSLNIIPLYSITQTWLMGSRKKITQIIANVFMFVPPGFICPAAFPGARKWWKTTAYMAIFSFGIEFVQYFIGRTADIDDFILNTLGGLLGYLIFYNGVKIRNLAKR